MNTLEVDVVVVGGGTAGCLAAMAAADEGASVALVEMDAALGGVGVRAGVHVYWYGSTGGYQHELDKACSGRARDFGIKLRGFHPDAKRLVLGDQLFRRGVHVFLNTMLAEVLMQDNRVVGIEVIQEGRRRHILSKVTIDSTGNGDVAKLAGATFHLGRSTDGAMQPFSLIPRVIEKKTKINFINFDVDWVDPMDPLDVTRGYREARKRLHPFLNDKEDIRLLSLSPQIGIREGRHIKGDYEVTFEDVIRDRTFSDTIIRAHSHYDNHAEDFGNETEQGRIWTIVLGLFRHSIGCDIPLRAIIPAGMEGLLVACRALSVERDASMVIRMQRDMQKLGEAAGVAAAMAAKSGDELRKLPISELQARLVKRGVLKESDLNRNSSPDIRFINGELRGVILSASLAASSYPSLRTYFGTDEEGQAIWWLWQAGQENQDVIPLLLIDLQQGETADIRRCAAYTLGLLNREECAEVLTKMVHTCDSEPGSRFKSHPRWLAAFVLLNRIKKMALLPEVLTLLQESHAPRVYTFLLSYVLQYEELWKPEEKIRIRNAFAQLLAKPDALQSHKLSGQRAAQSLRWSVQLQLAAWAQRNGFAQEANNWIAPHVHAPQAYVQNVLRSFTGDHREQACIDTGTYDLVLTDGGFQGFAKACHAAKSGRRVLILEPRGSLLWEATRARRSNLELRALPELVALLEQWNGYSAGTADPIALELAAEEICEQLGIDVIYHVQVDQAVAHDGGFLVAAIGKGCKLAVTCREFINVRSATRDDPPQDSGGTIWSLTLLDSYVSRRHELQIQLRDGISIPARVSPGREEGEAIAEFVYPSLLARGVNPELVLNRSIVPILEAIRASHEGMRVAKLAYLCDEAYPVPIVDLTNFSWESCDREIQLQLAGM